MPFRRHRHRTLHLLIIIIIIILSPRFRYLPQRLRSLQQTTPLRRMAILVGGTVQLNIKPLLKSRAAANGFLKTETTTVPLTTVSRRRREWLSRRRDGPLICFERNDSPFSRFLGFFFGGLALARSLQGIIDGILHTQERPGRQQFLRAYTHCMGILARGYPERFDNIFI